MSKPSLSILLYLGLAAAFSCDRSQPSPAPAETTVITRAGGEEAMAITIGAGSIDIRAGDRHIVGRTRGDQRSYRRDSLGGAPLVEVKGNAAGFKLRSPESQLLFKVKVADAKIKISDNEQNAHAWVMKTKQDGKVAVEDPHDREIGAVRLDEASGKIKVKDAAGRELFLVRSGKPSTAYGVLLVDTVPDAYRDVIVAELIARGQ